MSTKQRRATSNKAGLSGVFKVLETDTDGTYLLSALAGSASNSLFKEVWARADKELAVNQVVSGSFNIHPAVAAKAGRFATLTVKF